MDFDHRNKRTVDFQLTVPELLQRFWRLKGVDDVFDLSSLSDEDAKEALAQRLERFLTGKSRSSPGKATTAWSAPAAPAGIVTCCCAWQSKNSELKSCHGCG